LVVEVEAFRGVFYNTRRVESLGKVVSLPYDIITPEKRDEYYNISEYNITRLTLGKEEPGDDGSNKYVRAREYLDEWIKEGVLMQAEKPGVYVYQQEYRIDGEVKKQTGFIALVKLEPFEEGMILPHEKTYNSVTEDRYRLLEATEANLEAIISLYSDPDRKVNKILENAVDSKPLFELEHSDSIIHRMWTVNDSSAVEKVKKIMRDKKLYIADGHHRYITGLQYYRNSGGGDYSCKYIMMFLLNMEDDLTILPPHRLLKNIPEFSIDETLARIKRFFNVREYGNKSGGVKAREKMVEDLKARASKHVFGMLVKDRFFLISLKKSGIIDDLLDSSKSRYWNELDVTILQDVVIDYILGMKGNNKENISFTKDTGKAFKLIDAGEYQVAFLLNPPELTQVKAIADSGEVMPHKSTYFYPKILSGLVMYKF
jgi:uncharacterized protein (DUF1015 family)